MASGQTTLPPYVVIDLTQSDDEDLTVHTQVLPEPPIAIARRANALPASNNGLTLRDGASLSAAQEQKRDSGLGISSSSGSRGRLRGIGSPRTKRFPPSTHGGVPRLQNGTGQGHTWQGEHGSQQMDDEIPLANTAKRRKTHGGLAAATASHGLHDRRQTGQVIQTSAIRTPISRAESISSPSPDASITAIESGQPFQNGHREASQPTPPRSYRLSDKPDRISEERALAALDKQIFRHVRIALQGFRKTIPKVQRHRIFSKVIQKLLDEPDLLDDFEENHWTLPPNYEEKLAVKAKQYVDALASRVSVNSGALLSSESTSSDSFGSHDAWSTNQLSHAVSQDSVNQALDLSSTFSHHTEQISERLPKDMLQSHGLEPTPLGETDSSLPTPYSNSPTPKDKPNIELHATRRMRTKRPKIFGEVRRSSRLSGDANPTNIASKDSAQVGHCVNTKIDLGAGKYKPTAASIRKTQALRFSALENTPRPYIRSVDLEDIRRGCEAIKGNGGLHLSDEERELLERTVLHVDFCFEEIELIYKIITGANYPGGTDLKTEFKSIMAKRANDIEEICTALKRALSIGSKSYAWQLLRARSTADVCSFLEDATSGHITTTRRLICLGLEPRHGFAVPKPRISSLLRERDNWGMAPFRVRQGRSAFNVEITNHIEDSFVQQSEWTDCCGDISTVSWTGNDNFVCGATAHSDYHNMQYNKPGNLLVGSTSLDTLRAVDGHRIKRPIIGKAENADNALDSMRQTQDPWLYTSVVSTSYSEVSQCMFTASFDETVKIWKVAHDGSSMSLCGEWKHDGKVNFVVTSENHNKVATASDVSSNAIRVYIFNEQDIPRTPYNTYRGDKAQEQAAELERENSWAYFPATIQWGKAEIVANFLLVGYSPRSSTGHDADIPDEKKNSGQLCIWDVENGQRVQISSARTQNVFEVVWHPTRPMFLAATSPCGTYEPEVKTQIRLYALSNFGTFVHLKTLDCPALDINELTIQPNSLHESYVSASCTDGNTYVWDTAQGDSAIHVLGHGTSLDNPLHDLPLEIADSGVKFASWGQSVGRFYTGSSDGKVKAWDVRAPKGEAFVRTVLSLSGGISAGAFSKDFSKLLIGDATGKVHLINVNDAADYYVHHDIEDKSCAATEATRMSSRRDNATTEANDGLYQYIKKPKVIIPHPEPLPPSSLDSRYNIEGTAHGLAQAFITSGQLTVHPDRGVGAIQGPNYSDALLYRYEAHEHDDGTKPLRPEWSTRQQYILHSQKSQIRIPRLRNVEGSETELHNSNKSLDLDPFGLSSELTASFAREGIDLNFKEHYQFDLEQAPRYKIFQDKSPSTRP